MPIFVTLTYPATWPARATEWKRHLDTWLKRLARAFPGASAVWKMEYQRRGAPHFHLLIFGVQYIPARWVANAWYEIVGSQDEKHLRAGTRIEACRSWRGVMAYASKYLGKTAGEGATNWPGRFWGVHNRAALPVEWLAFALTFGQFYRVRRQLLAWERATYKSGRAAGAPPGVPWRTRPPGEWQGLTLWGAEAALLGLLRLAT